MYGLSISDGPGLNNGLISNPLNRRSLMNERTHVLKKISNYDKVKVITKDS